MSSELFKTPNRSGKPSAGILRPSVVTTVSFMLLIAANSLAQENPDSVIRVQPDLALQAEIQSVAEAGNQEESRKALDRIRAVGEHDCDRLIPQLLHYAGQGDDGKAKTAVGWIIKRLDLPEQTVVSALVPHLDNEDTSIRKAVRSLLHDYEDRSAGRPPDFSAYRAIIEAKVRAGEEVQESMVRFMYESDPGIALLTFMRGYQLRDPKDLKAILWAEHVVAAMLWKRQFGFLKPEEVEPAAVEQLGKLSVHERWWARMYVAEILRRHSELRRPELLQRLKQDSHSLVRRTAILAVKEN